MTVTQEELDERLSRIKARLSANEKRVLLALAEHPEGASPDVVVASAGFAKEAEAANAANWLADKGLLEVEESAQLLASLDKEGAHHAAEGLPERRVLRALGAMDPGKGSMKALAAAGVVAGHEVPIALGWLKRKGWADISKEDGETILSLRPEVASGDVAAGDDEALLARLAEAGDVLVASLAPAEQKAWKELKGRKGLVKEREQKDRLWRRTADGVAIVSSGLEVTEELVQLTSEDLRSGRWREVSIRPYDVAAFAPALHGGRSHPLTLLIEEIREVFVAMGFAEITGDYVQSAFWNMDALFIPQNHPAREMQDTFYLDHPARIELDPDTLRSIGKVHEDGGDTESRGWGGTFSNDIATRGLLRTHTTVGTIQHLKDNPDEPCKVFSIGRVFRKETMDATHLPEFHQVEGIIKEPKANFRVLVGLMREFFKRMGFEGIRLRPAYFPYTEPSMEVDVFYDGRWMELGGSGIFRPEVCLPHGVKDPVCAWGLGLERLAMMRFGLKDIRDIYVSDLDWLRTQPLRQTYG